MSHKQRNITSALCYTGAVALAFLAVASGFKSIQYGYEGNFQKVPEIKKSSDTSSVVSAVGHNTLEVVKGFSGEVRGDLASWLAIGSGFGAVVMTGLGVASSRS
jgi:hypothetical protein